MVITISRQVGSGGREIGLRLAERLGLRFLDREIIESVARQLQVPFDSVAEKDEMVEGWRERLAQILPFGLPETGVLRPAIEQEYEPLTAQKTLRATQEVIREAARAGNAVIVGRGAQVILASQPGTVHLFVYAPREVRVERMLKLRPLDHFDARRLTEQFVEDYDRRRAEYLRHFYRRDWRDPELYDLVLNSGRMGIAGAVELLEWWLPRFIARGNEGAGSGSEHSSAA